MKLKLRTGEYVNELDLSEMPNLHIGRYLPHETRTAHPSGWCDFGDCRSVWSAQVTGLPIYVCGVRRIMRHFGKGSECEVRAFY